MTRHALLLVTLLLTSCTVVEEVVPNLSLLSPTGQRLDLVVEVADDPAEQQRGLMHRTELTTDHGMLFVFEEPKVLVFWMKDTLIPLDILFFDASGTFVHAATMTPCTVPSGCPTWSSVRESLTALEVPAGFATAHGVGPGWRMEWRR